MIRLFNWLRLFLSLVWVGFLVSNGVIAGPSETMESLLMPGEVAKAHSRYEKQCKKCHQNFKKESQSKLCLDCHKEIGRDIKKKNGFHGKLKKIKKRKCKSCHTEHKGRERDIAPFDKAVFNHSRTNFKLKGWHVQMECTDCHNPNSKYRDAQKNCVACHKEDDKHKSRLGKDCNNCHTEDLWQASYFDHDKTDFKLKSGHKNVGCVDCHPNERYENTPVKCFFCHELDDTHKGAHGKKCDNCHVEKSWLKVKFDHNKDTNFKLEYIHAKLECRDCHEKNIYKKTMDRDCFACHKLWDKHKAQYGKDCHVCHTTEKWSEPSFDHNEDTNFRRRGKHKEVICEDCHRGLIFKEKLTGSCFGCHQVDDVHFGQEGKNCQKCHDERGWATKVVFDHDVTNFPLHGAHGIVPCNECHTSEAFKKDVDVKCMSCHKQDDIHKLRLGPVCELCHRPYYWLVWEFDHDKQTDFILDGSHKGIDCHACHKEPVKDKIEMSMVCYSCHWQDDNHNGNLGTQCDKCHVTSSFKKRKIN